MDNYVYSSPKLAEFPERILIITDKNFANVCSKLTECLRGYGLDVWFLDARKKCNVQDAFNYDHSKCLAIYYDLGSFYEMDRNQFTHYVNTPPDMPWGLYHGSSFYRVANLEFEDKRYRAQKEAHKEPRKSSNLTHRTYHPTKKKFYGHKNATGPNNNRFDRLRNFNEYFDSLTPLVIAGTEDLLAINPRSVFLGQPQKFEPYIQNKMPNMVGHISSPLDGRNARKGTDKIAAAFNRINLKHWQTIKTDVIGMTKVPQDACMKFLRTRGISVCTMTDWDYGMGYVGLESLATSCLTMSKNSEYAKQIGSKIIDIRDSNDLFDKIVYYQNHLDEFEAKRREQYDWATKHFAYESIVQRFIAIIQDTVANEWEMIERPYLRTLDFEKEIAQIAAPVIANKSIIRPRVGLASSRRHQQNIRHRM